MKKNNHNNVWIDWIFGTFLLSFDSASWNSITMGITKYLQSMRLFWGSAEADLITSLIKSSDDINGIFWHQGLRILLLNYTYILSGYQKLGWSPMHLLELVFYYQASVIINLPRVHCSNLAGKNIFSTFCLFLNILFMRLFKDSSLGYSIIAN